MFAKPTMQNSTIVLYILLPVFFVLFYDVPLLQQTDISPIIDFTSCLSCWCSGSELKRGYNRISPVAQLMLAYKPTTAQLAS